VRAHALAITKQFAPAHHTRANMHTRAGAHSLAFRGRRAARYIFSITTHAIGPGHGQCRARCHPPGVSSGQPEPPAKHLPRPTVQAAAAESLAWRFSETAGRGAAVAYVGGDAHEELTRGRWSSQSRWRRPGAAGPGAFARRLCAAGRRTRRTSTPQK